MLRASDVRLHWNAAVRLEAELAGEPIDPARHEPGVDVKAATAHGLRIGPARHDDKAFEARVTLDV